MLVHITKDHFAHAISRAEKVAGKNLSLPVLRCVLLVASEKQLKVRATNLDVGIEITVPAKIEKEGVLAVPADVLSSFVGALYRNDTLTIEVANGTALVSTKHNTTKIKTLPHEDFPTLPTLENAQELTIKADMLVKALKSVWYAGSTTSIKPELASVYVASTDDALVSAATDSFRLAEKKVATKGVAINEPLLIPIKNVGEIIRNLEGQDGSVTLSHTNTQLALSHENIYLTSRIVDGTFPDYGQLIPDGNTTEVIVLKQDLVNALRLSNIFTNKFHQVGFHINPKEKYFMIQTTNADVGENEVAVDATLKGEAIESNFNYKYIMDCFQSIPEDSVSLTFNGAGRPLVIRGVGDNTFTYLVMPMNK